MWAWKSPQRGKGRTRARAKTRVQQRARQEARVVRLRANLVTRGLENGRVLPRERLHIWLRQRPGDDRSILLAVSLSSKTLARRGASLARMPTLRLGAKDLLLDVIGGIHGVGVITASSLGTGRIGVLHLDGLSHVIWLGAKVLC